MSTPAQLRIAARIHYSLKHLLGEGVDVAAMLRSTDEAQEVLWVCQASGNAELEALASEYQAAATASAPLAAAKPPALAPELQAAPQDATWASNTTGFGNTGFDSTGFGLSTLMPSPTQDSTLGQPKPARKASLWRDAVQLLARRTPKDPSH